MSGRIASCSRARTLGEIMCDVVLAATMVHCLAKDIEPPDNDCYDDIDPSYCFD